MFHHFQGFDRVVEGILQCVGPQQQAQEIARNGGQCQFSRQHTGLFPIFTCFPKFFLRIREEIPAAAEEEQVGNQQQTADTHAVGGGYAQSDKNEPFDRCFR